MIPGKPNKRIGIVGYGQTGSSLYLYEQVQQTTELHLEVAFIYEADPLAEKALQQTDLMIMSVSALADADIEANIRSTCHRYGTRLYIPHSATLELDSLKDAILIWEPDSLLLPMVF